jgi:spore coat polysaccharide biosynthesis protein SpsF
MPRVIASIEARMGSSRLPGKVLADIAGEPALTRLVRRLRLAKGLDGIVLATTTEPADDVLEEWAGRQTVAVHRGSESDVLGRVVAAQESMGSDVVVEITGDNVLGDPELIDLAVETFLKNDCDVVTNSVHHSYPNGMEVQVFTLDVLADVARRVDDPVVREHVSLYFYEHPDLYRIVHLLSPRRWARPDYRLVLDYPEDLVLMNEVYRRLEPLHGDAFGLDEILALLEEEPGLAALNRDLEDKPVR